MVFNLISSNRGYYYRFYSTILVWFYIINGIHGQQLEEIGIQDIPNFITSNETYHVISGTDLEIVCQVTQSNVDIIISYESFDSQHSGLKTLNNSAIKIIAILPQNF